MLEIELYVKSDFDEETNEFIDEYDIIHLEHSLFTMSKWEEKHLKPFLSKEDKTEEEVQDYISDMIIGKIPDDFYERLSQDNIRRITDYIGSKATATTFYNEKKNDNSNKKLTTEVIYYLMFSRGIPKECEHWHINRLLTLIKIYDEYSGDRKPMPKSDIIQQHRDINAMNRARFHSRG